MKFKPIGYRMGYGKNVRGRYNNGRCLLYYKNRDGVVNIKEIKRTAGGVELIKVVGSFNGTTLIPFNDGYILANKDKEIKSIKV